jgi:hypothetical protein
MMRYSVMIVAVVLAGCAVAHGRPDTSSSSPTAKKKPMQPTNEEIEQGLAIAKANVKKALELPDLPVKEVRVPRFGYPYQYDIIFEDGRGWQMLVFDGKVVEKRDNKVLGQYFKKIDLLSRRDWPFATILGAIDMWGERPPVKRFMVSRDLTGPGPNDLPGMKWTDNTLTLVIYCRWEPMNSGPPAPVAHTTYLRATMKITPVYDLEWKVERCDHVDGTPDVWKPFSG